MNKPTSPEEVVARSKATSSPLKYAPFFFVSSFLALLVYLSLSLELHREWGSKFILSVQAYRSLWPDFFFRFFGLFGFEVLFLVIPYFLWSGNKDHFIVALELIPLELFGWVLVSSLKLYFIQHRPVWVLDEINSFADSALLEYSFPSGHTFGTTIAWLVLCNHFRFLIFPAIIFAPLTAFSRVYFGFHFPHDIFAGALLAFILFNFKKYFLPNEYLKKSAQSTPSTSLQRSKSTYFQVFLCVSILIFCATQVSPLEMEKHLGIYYSLGGLLTLIVFQRALKPLELLSDTKLKFLLRVLVGSIPVVIFGLLLHKLKLNSLMFVVGVAGTSWYLYFAPIVFKKLNLASNTQSVKQQ
eukprot:TRINITY_DN2668_c0_g1_i1.p1 TRINITY_DN2668_c0_g1~~TRINITY_DN2668_c0_g1_i1.p1  ORF type:complete len:355 (-),score=56.68 TRINITY_DN2668_c0_g1_i1:81-1145(-)